MMNTASSRFKRIFDIFRPHKIQSLEERAREETIAQQELAKYLLGGDTTSGLPVDRVSAMGVSVVRACVRLLSETVASLPTILYRRITNGKERATDHWAYRLMHEKPNDEQTPFYFKETMQHHAVLLGNAYAFKQMNGRNQVVGLIQMDTSKMEVKRNDAGKIRYHLGQNTGPATIYRPDQILHIPGLGYDGMKGYPVLNQVRDIIGHAQAIARYGQEFFANYGGPGGYIAHPGKIGRDKEAIKRFKASWNDAHKDWGKKHSIGVLEEGAEFKPIHALPNEAQFTEAWRFLITEVCRMFGVQPHLVAELSRATFSNIEHQGLEFVTYTMRPWLVRWEQALSRSILPDEDQEEYFFEFLVDALLRGDIQARSQAYRTYIEMGVMSPNEVRATENMNPFEGGDQRFVPMNWVPIDMAAEAAAPTPPPDMGEPEEDERSLSSIEIRSAQERYRIAKAHQRLMLGMAERIVKADIRELKKGVDKHLKSRDITEFNTWLDEHFRELPKYIRQQAMPVYRAMMVDVKAAVASELGIDGEIAPEDEQYVSAFVTLFITRYLNVSRAGVESTITAAIDEGREADEELERMFERWAEGRPSQIALNESVGSSNAFAKNAMLLAGVTVLRWVALGPKSCPFCQSMNGRVVEITKSFTLPGDQIVAANDSEMNIKRFTGTPPLHRGCVCQIVAG